MNGNKRTGRIKISHRTALFLAQIQVPRSGRADPQPLPLQSGLLRAALAMRLGSLKLLLSEDIDEDSRLLLYRNIRERVARIAPFLRFDSDPYMVLREDGTLASFTAVAAPTIYRGDRLPAELSGNAFVAEPSGNLVSRIIVDDDGKGLRGRKAYAQGEFIVSTDERFRPVYLSSAPDGTLYVVDLYRGIIQHKGYITEYLRDQILSRKLEQPTALGRVYRAEGNTEAALALYQRALELDGSNQAAKRAVDELSE